MRYRFTHDLTTGTFEEVDEAQPAEVVAALKGLDFDAFPCIEITGDDGCVLEASGSNEDGFSIIYRDGDHEFITKEGPSLDELFAVVEAYARKANDWAKIVVFDAIN